MHIVNSMAANFGKYDLDVSAVGMRSISETDIKLPYTGVLPVQMSASSGAYVYLNVQLASTSSWLKAHAWFWLRMERARISSVLSKRPVKRLSLCWMGFSSKTKTLPALLSIGSACGKLIIRNGERS